MKDIIGKRYYWIFEYVNTFEGLINLNVAATIKTVQNLTLINGIDFFQISKYANCKQGLK